ncbi:MAG: hypothetical protein J0M37_13485 [Ignavibacteria bacterium]|nr:hypothetical protein [Ignavibacteria bacterium]
MEEKKEITKTEDIVIFNEVFNRLKSLDKASIDKVLKMLITYFDFKENNSIYTEKTSHSYIASNQNSLFSEDRTIGPKQFILEKNPSTDVERVACLAYYLTHYRNQPHFKTLDISMLNTEAAQRKFSNAAISVDNATSRGYLVPVGKGMKQLSAIGELYVQALPDKVTAQEVMSKMRKKKSKKNNKTEKVN